MIEMQIVWRMGEQSGRSGYWWPESYRDSVVARTESLNKFFGEGTHWIEEREAPFIKEKQ